MLLAPRSDFYAAGLPEPADVRLLAEVADGSLSYDRRTKLPLYARAGVAEAWLVDPVATGSRSIADRAAVPTTTSASRARPSRSLPPASPTLR
jgi:hypothetical protein